MKISVALATYNGSKFLIKQLKSLMDQTLAPDEVIIFDDCSSDDTSLIVKSFIEENNLKNWYFYVNESNVGCKRNFYNAISKTTGDLIFLCDQDDIWHSNKIELMAQIMENNPKIGLLGSSYFTIDSNDNKINISLEKNKSNNNLFPFSLEENVVTKINYNTIVGAYITIGCATVITKELKNIYLERSNCKIFHDLELFIYAFVLDKLYFYNKKLIDYRIHSSNTVGLDILKNDNSLNIRGNINTRKNILNSQKDHCDILESYFVYNKLGKRQKKFVKKFRKYLTLREKCLSGFDLISWFKMFIYISCMREMHWPILRSMVGDLIYMVKVEKILSSKN